MIIRYLETEQVEVRAPADEMQSVCEAIEEFGELDEELLSFPAHLNADPEAFDRCLNGIVIKKAEGKVDLFVSVDDNLVIEAHPQFLEALAGYFEFEELEEGDEFPDPHHLEYHARHHILADTAVPLVIGLSTSDEDAAAQSIEDEAVFAGEG